MAVGSIPIFAIVSHDSRSDLGRTLPGSLSLVEALDTRLVVVDNASTDGTLEFLNQAQSPRLLCEPLSRNVGYAAAVNRAFALSDDRDVLLVNPDVHLGDAEPIARLLDCMHAHPEAGVVAPRLLDPDGTPQPSARRFPSLASMLGSLPIAGRVAPLRRAYARYLSPAVGMQAQPVDWVLGAAMLIRRRAFESVAGWDERYFLYMEDADFCKRLWGHGWSVVLAPSAELIHEYGRESTQRGVTVLASRARRRHFRSLARFFTHHPRLFFGL